MKKIIACIFSFFLMTIIIFVNKIPIEALVVYTVTSDVYAAQSSSYTIKIPKKISLSGNDGTAIYGVSLKGNISGTDVISVIPSNNFIMSQKGKEDVIANITQNNTDFTYANGVRPDVDVVYVGNINMESISAGKWYGTFNFDIYSSIEVTNDSISSDASDIYEDNILGRDYEQNKTTEYKELRYCHYHDFINESSKEPTCTDLGYEKYVCLSCKTINIDEVEAIGHNYTTTVVKSTCCVGGYTLYECTVCGHSYIDNYNEPLGHKYNEQSGVCGDCGESQAGVYDSNGLLQSWDRLINNNILAVDENGVLYNPNPTQSNILANNMNQKLIIGEGVKVIKEKTFEYCVSLLEVSMPDSIVEIEPYAFYRCDSLRRVEFSDRLMKIGEGAFEKCYTLEAIKLPTSLREVHQKAFFDCNSLRNVDMDDCVITRLEKSTFENCYTLEQLTLPSTLEQIDERVFFNCNSLKHVDMSNCKVTKLKESAFENCLTLLDVIFSDELISIENRVFFNCDTLSSVSVGYNILVIGESAFQACDSLTEFNILNNNISYIGKDAFRNCNILGKIFIKGIIFENNVDFNNFVYQSGLSHTTKIWHIEW